MNIQPTLHAAELRVGQPIAPLERTLSVVRMAAYAGATWDWHRLHYDPDYAKARNLPNIVVDGQMLGALLAEALLDWFGPRAFIRRLNFRQRSPIQAGAAIRCEGEITSIAAEASSDVVRVAQRIRVGERTVVEQAFAEIALPK
jgi:acyl dehydratase